MTDHTNDAPPPYTLWGVRPARLALWAGLGAALVGLMALGLASHKTGMPTVTPGKKVAPLSQQAVSALTNEFQALRKAHVRAPTRQADANG